LRLERLSLLAAAAAVVALFVFSSCQTATVTHVLPAYEPPIAKSDLQHVRTTAYTHTEADHRQYGARNALGGELHAAGPAIHRRADNPVRPPITDVGDQLGYERLAYSGAPRQPFSTDDDEGPVTMKVKVKTHSSKTKHPTKRAVAVSKKPPKIGSAAADWSRWPAGTTFRIISTGQIYQVEDYGWALAGRNTIDLYMPNQRAMNSWGEREEPIQIIHWGSPDTSLKFLLPRQQYKHVRRMVLELQGNEEEAAALR
jgi:3D (Asp-Asp-Asp) domain-containing protein